MHYDLHNKSEILKHALCSEIMHTELDRVINCIMHITIIITFALDTVLISDNISTIYITVHILEQLAFSACCLLC